MLRWCWIFCLGWWTAAAWGAHAYAQFGDVKYPPGFHHFDYVDPAAPKGGEIVLVSNTRVSTYDKYNPFTLKGTAPSGLSELVFESLLTSSLDEPTTAYGLLAEDVTVAADGRSATFRLRPEARFHNGDPVLAADVRDSYLRLVSKEASPLYRSYFGDIQDVVVVGERVVRFDFKRANAELPILAGQLPVFSRRWGGEGAKRKPFDQIVTDVPIGSGPYRIGRVDFGKDITYERDPNYWARDINVRRGFYNFDRVTYRIYKDDTARLEAFKAGEFDLIQVSIARQWARSFTGAKFDKGELVKRELPHRNAAGAQSFIFNIRLPKFKDPRVRRAIGLALDFEWLNRQLFYNAYTRVNGFFPGGDFEARGLPGPDELALLAPLRAKLRPEVFTAPVPDSPTTTPPRSLRENLRLARDLLAQAGWTYRDGALRNARGEAFTMEITEDMMQGASMGRIITPFMQNLGKLGIQANMKIVDFALYQQRLDAFDFEMTSLAYPGSLSPGAELLDLYGSQSASTQGSNNFIGIADPAVDALIEHVLAATTRPQQVAALRALDRVLRFSFPVVPSWYSNVHRIAYRNHRFGEPAVKPLYYSAEAAILGTWWSLPGK